MEFLRGKEDWDSEEFLLPGKRSSAWPVLHCLLGVSSHDRLLTNTIKVWQQ